MTLGQGNKGLAADRTIFYNRFIQNVRNAYLGVGNTNVVWYSGNAPPYNPGSLGARALTSSDPSGGVTLGSEFGNAQVVTILNALGNFALQMTRYRIYNYTYTRTPGPDTTGSGFTAFNATYLSLGAFAIPAIPAGYAIGQKITLEPLASADPVMDPFMTTLLNSLIAFRAGNQVSRTFCHSSCHSSCHGARGRR